MEIQEALKIMRALADGISPETGETLTSDLVYQYAPVVRAFHRAVGALEYVEERERSSESCPRTRVSPGRGRKTSRCVKNCAGESISTRSRRPTIEPSARLSRGW